MLQEIVEFLREVDIGKTILIIVLTLLVLEFVYWAVDYIYRKLKAQYNRFMRRVSIEIDKVLPK